jgi:YidC/Oxa1 family membrane protein insertase
VNRLLAIPRNRRRVLVYSEDTFSYVHFASVIQEVRDRYGHRVIYVTSEPKDPLLQDSNGNLAVYYLNRLVPIYFPYIDSELFITTMPDLGKFHIDRPSRKSRCVYVFHSLNSVHMAYREGAFDNYDVFFCAAAHQYMELEALFRARRLPVPVLHEVGYPKLERIHAAHQGYVKRHRERETILIAPSWGRHNVLERHGIELVRRLLRRGYRVVVRPHPCFFLPLYRGGRAVVEELERAIGADPDFSVERTIEDEQSFHEADLMISDWSGAAFEYALGTERPVLFVDVPRKALNPEWEALGLVPFEDFMRERVGAIMPGGDVAAVSGYVERLLAAADDYRRRTRELRARYVYHFGSSAQVAAGLIDDLLRGSTRQ